MYKTIQLSSCVSVQGEFVEDLGNGEVVVRDGPTIYRGRLMSEASSGVRHGQTAGNKRRSVG